jgi:hypothetical protein
VSLQCQKIEIKKLPFYASDITNFTSAVCAVVTEMSTYGEPLFESWADTYSGDLYDTFTTVSTYSSFWQQTDDSNVNTFVYSNSANILQSNSVVNFTSGNWNSVYNSYNSSSASFLTISSANSRYVKLSGDVMTGGLSSPSLSTNNLYVAGSTINFFDGTGSVIETLKSNDVGNFKSNYTLTNSRSANWENTYSGFSSQSANNISVYSNVNSNSGNWNYQGTDIKSLTSNWENTYSNFSIQSGNNISVYNTFNSNSSNYNSVYNTVNSNSSTNWNYQGTDIKSLTSNWQASYTALTSTSANWNDTRNTVQTNSGTWNYQGTDIKSLTSNWENTYSVVSSSSANWNNVYSIVQTNSSQWAIDTSIDNGVRALTGNWQDTYTGFSSQSSNNISVYSSVNSNSANWNSTYSTVNTNSASNWNYQGSDIKSLTGNWQNTYIGFSSQSGNNVSVYSSVNSKSANWDSVYSTVNSNSATNWNYQGNDIKELSSNWQNTYNNFSVQSANNVSVYNSFNSNSSNYNSVYSTVNSNSATTWNYQGTDIKALTGNWQNTYIGFSSQSANNNSVYNSFNSNSSNYDSVYNTVNTNSGSNWNYQGNDIKALTGDWQASYTALTSTSANWNDTRNTVQTNSATNWNYQGNDIKALTGNWQSTYTTVSSFSATWGRQTLSFNESNAQLTISDGNTVSLSSLSGGNGSSGVSYLSALNDVYIPSPANGQVLTYSSVLQKWTTGSPASASGQTGYYGSFYDTTAQILTGTNQAKRLDIADTFEANGISLSSNKIVFNNIGTYEIIFSIQYKNTSSTQEDIYVWFRKNGVDVPDSSSVFTIPARKNENIPAQLIAVTPFIATLAANDFIEIYWHCNNTAVTVETFTTHANPTIPDTPGVIITVKQVTNVQLVPTVGAYLPLSGGTVTGVLSTTNVIYTSGGDSTQWNSSYTTVNANSGSWGSGGGGVSGAYLPLSGGTMDNGAIISFDNYSRIRQNPNGTENGIDLVCSIDYVHRWKDGFLYIYDQSNQIRTVYYGRDLIPNVNYDSSQGYIVGSIYVQDNGNSYICIDNSVGTAVWEIWNTVGNYLPLSGGTLTGALSTTDILYTSGGNSTQWNSTYTNFSFQSANNISVYNTVASNSATWGTGGGGGGGTSVLGIDYFRWQIIGLSSTAVYSIVGANSNTSEAYRVTINAAIQDPIEYTVDNTADTITFSSNPPENSDIIVIETIPQSISVSALSADYYINKPFWNSTYSTVQTNSSTWGTGGGGSFTVEDANAIIGLSMFL